MWRAGTLDEGFRFTGIGYKVGPQMKKYIAEFEAGLLVDFYHKGSTYQLKRIAGSKIPYIRLHMGFRFKERFAWGLQGNWMPPTNSIRFTELRFPNPGQGFDVVKSRPNRHVSACIFLGISID